MLKRIIRVEILFWAIAGLFVLLSSCKKENHQMEIAKNMEPSLVSNEIKISKETSKEFKNYWYAGKAEISSYKLEQERYGEIRDGHAVLIYVTEDFLSKKQVKADRQNSENVSVLKLNATKKFNTGIYPYSIMQSTFYPVTNNKHAIKVSSSIQEWCGHVYAQLNNKDQFEIMSHSYFESEADEKFYLKKAILENELWTQLRIDPMSLPTGSLKIIPSFEYTRLRHKSIRAYNASAILTSNTYTITYPDLNRILTLNFNPKFPYDIFSWEESSGNLRTKATKLKTIKSAYWNKNNNRDKILRDTLRLN